VTVPQAEAGAEDGVLARNVRAKRRALGMTQVDLAVSADVTPSTVQRIERGLPTTETSLRKISRALGCGIGDLTDAVPDDGTNGDNDSPKVATG
jgi:transcriptional regulator with XRE-family HTH domain